ncbi:MAG: response regulator [Candidatus Nealsonbacteria bacterium CG_4_10_14_0_2_um_filter_39_15]|uniref:Response regulator n=2 Tax=Candidatus Nealsoniibacteriota TaxID=1817911 RepID=A0A2M7UVG5_9BACT|nr:MAG: response regulator [Candidatus Nealsonbacteria bacterium CG_4_10_14_0_2_um_filter_39_15]
MLKKILLIEDEKILAEMYKEKFSQAGFEVLLAFESKEGLKMVKKERPDLIVLDILLPRENGITFLGWLRQDPEIAATPVVAFSNYDDPETKKQALKLGAKDYLIKTNYTPSEIVAKIKQLLVDER